MFSFPEGFWGCFEVGAGEDKVEIRPERFLLLGCAKDLALPTSPVRCQACFVENGWVRVAAAMEGLRQELSQ